MDVDALAREVADRQGDGARPIESLTCVDIGRNLDLDSYLYRTEPGAGALLLVLRAGELAYIAFVSNWFNAPEESRSDGFPPRPRTRRRSRST